MDTGSELPLLFYSTETGLPFAVCIDCQQPLTEALSYTINKVFRRDEVIFEVAICDACQARLMESFSEASRFRLQRWLIEHLRDEKPSIERCAFTGIPRIECDEYELGARCVGSLAIETLCISETARAEVEEHLSPETRDTWDRFVQDHFPGLPADQPAPLLI